MAHIDERHRRRLRERLSQTKIASPRLDKETSLSDILMACPQCGEEALVDTWIGQTFGEAFLQCLLCGYSAPGGKSLLEAADSWNIEAKKAGRKPLG